MLGNITSYIWDVIMTGKRSPGKTEEIISKKMGIVGFSNFTFKPTTDNKAWVWDYSRRIWKDLTP